MVGTMPDRRCSCRLPDDLVRRLKEAAEGFQRFGAGYWPGADHFVLLELDAEGSCTGDARDVCRCCVREAARLVEARLVRPGLVLLDLVGDSSPGQECCCICGARPGA
jgi:hypothetical protein